MPKPSCDSDNMAVHSPWSRVHSPADRVFLWTIDYGLWTKRLCTSINTLRCRLLFYSASVVTCALSAGCATPQYAIRQTPAPDESAGAIQIERTISAYQAKEFERQGARPIGLDEPLQGFAVQRIVDQLSRVTERAALHYRAFLYHDKDPNAAALADGRIYISTGLLDYLGSRLPAPPQNVGGAQAGGSRADEPFDSSRRGGTRSGRNPERKPKDELAFVLGHELGHTVAQHLVKRYRTVEQQQLLMALLAAGASVATRNAGAGAQEAGRLALDVASLLRDVANSGYSQEQELEADQLGIRYVIRAGFDPRAALDLLQDFARFDNPWPFLRTHPYISLRRGYLERYLQDAGYLGAPVAPVSSQAQGSARVRELRDVQKLYPVGSVSWKNLQRQIDALEDSR